ncbi:MAG: thiamine pyrophosphate-dependent enzyme [Asticcacaulis sp.]
MADICDVLVKMIAEAGVKHIFGLPGDSINALTDAIRRQDLVKFIHVNHEETGGFAAVGHAKLTGGLGVCCGTSGPGAIHLLNALYDAKCDHAPVLAITGQVETRMIGSDYQQEVDLHTLFDSVCVYNQIVTSPDNFGYIAAQAIQAAIEQRGVAHLNIPLDLATQSVPHSGKWHVKVPDQRSVPVRDADIEQASALIDKASKVAILAGIGCAGAEDKVLALAERLGAPVVHALRAKDLFPESHPLSIGGIGNLGIRPSVHAFAHCDLLLMIGTSFPYVEYLPKKAKVVQIDFDPRQIAKRIPVDCGIVGDAGAVAERLMAAVRPKTSRAFLHDVQRHKASWREDMLKDVANTSTPVHPARLAHLVGEAADDNAIFVCDTGEVTGWVARYLDMRAGQRFLVSGLLATMAFSQGAAIGATLAEPERQTVVLTGDGGFSMLMTDFSTAVKYRLPMLIVVFNNARLGLIQLEQEVKGMPNYETDLHNPDFAAFARLCGGDGLRVTDPDSLPDAIRQGLSSPLPFVLDVVIDSGPMIIPPKITAAQAAGFGLAKAKEMMGQG